MNAVGLVLVLLGAPAFAFGVSNLQASLERWDYHRSAQD